jgi:hypothetical protein
MRVLAPLLLGVALTACGGPAPDGASPPAQEAAMSPRPIDAVLRDHDEAILAIPGVTMIYVGADAQGEPVIKVGVETATPEVEERIPDRLEGWPVEVVETGEVRPLDEEP